MTAQEESKSDSIQKSLTKDLSKLQSRLEFYEDQLVKAAKEEAQFIREQIGYYRAEAGKVRQAILEMHHAAMAELKR